jgi:CTP synthase
MQDCYKSILESFIHAGAANETKVNVVSIHSEYITVANVKEKLQVDAVLVVAQVLEKEELKEKN